LLTDSIVGVARKQHAFVDTEGNRYIAIGTDKFLLIFFEGQLFDVTPLATTISSATFTFNGFYNNYNYNISSTQFRRW
jgi:hypothetical protein